MVTVLEPQRESVDIDKSLLGQLLCDDAHRLPAAVRSFHASIPDVTGSGEVYMRQASTRLGRLLARAFRLPRGNGPTPVALTIRRHSAIGRPGISEHWCRRFDGQGMESILTTDGDHLTERIGPLELLFSVSIVARRLRFDHIATRIHLGPLLLPLPRTVAPRVAASVGGDDEHLDVSVQISAAVFGTLLAYEGRLAQVDV